MKPETRLALLEAFASSKAAEFDGFTHAYLEEHPEPLFTETVNVNIDVFDPPIEEKPKRKRKTAEVIESV